MGVLSEEGIDVGLRTIGSGARCGRVSASTRQFARSFPVGALLRRSADTVLPDYG